MTNETMGRYPDVNNLHDQFDERDVAFSKTWRGFLRRGSLLRKNLMTMVAAVSMTAWNAFGSERITVDEVVNHYPWDGKVDCVCTLSGLESGYDYKGTFTLTVRKAGETVRRIVTNAFVAVDGTYTNTFDCTVLFGAGLYPNGGIAVELIRDIPPPPADATGTPIGIIGDVLVIDVSAGSAAATYPTKELPCVDIGTFNCDVYKTDKIVLRKVSAGTYCCQPRKWNDSDFDNLATQQLTTRGFFIGVFPVTQRQYERVMGTNPSKFQADDTGNVAAQRPVESVSWNAIRGSSGAGTTITEYSDDSFLRRLVEKTGLSGFDLPTEAQWEIACRANATATYGAYWNGKASVEMTSATIGEAAWSGNNSASTTHAVGGKHSNLWGLYDMQGNVWEWCRDIYILTYNESHVDIPCTEGSYSSGRNRVRRGGGWYDVVGYCRPSYRSHGNADTCYYGIGFRLSRNLP